MKNFQIETMRDQRLLFEGRFRSFKHCVEQAVRDKVKLQGANLRNRNFTNAMLDDGDLIHVDFSGANLTGANLSEAKLAGARFIGADLYNTCFAWSDMRGCRFDHAAFGGTDITGCDLSLSVFSSLSCFQLDFAMAAAMRECSFSNPDGLVARMSKPPVVIRGASENVIIFMDQHVKIGHEMLEYPDGIALLSRRAKTH